MNPEKIITGLTAAQADGLAWVVCELEYLRALGSASAQVGRSVTGSQGFGCVGGCAEVCGVDPPRMGASRGWWVRMSTADQNPQVCRRDRALWLQCASTALVALGAAYTSYRHGREFALRYGADDVTAGI